MASVRTNDVRVITVKRNGFCAVTVHDQISSGNSFDFNSARQLADALENGADASIATRDGGVLDLRGFDASAESGRAFRFGVRSNWGHGSPQGANPQVADRPRGPWVLDEDQVQALAEALRKEIGS